MLTLGIASLPGHLKTQAKCVGEFHPATDVQ